LEDGVIALLVARVMPHRCAQQAGTDEDFDHDGW
jgi:hypothetical protein